MGIRFYCPNGCKIHVKAFQAGKRGICPHCGCSVDIPLQSTRGSSKEKPRASPQEIKPPPQGNQAKKPGGPKARSSNLPGTSEAPHPRSASPAPNSLEMQPPPPLPGSMAGPSMVTPELLPVEPVFPPAASPSPPPSTILSSGPRDPFEQSPNAIWYVCPPTGGQFGPATNEVMRSWLAEGRVPPDSMVWRDGWVEWKTAAEVFPATFFPPTVAPDTFPALAPLLPSEDATLGPPLRGAPSPAPSTLAQLFVLMVVLALGGGILAAVYVWARFF
mgnify:CR=1 FL=1